MRLPVYYFDACIAGVVLGSSLTWQSGPHQPAVCLPRPSHTLPHPTPTHPTPTPTLSRFLLCIRQYENAVFFGFTTHDPIYIAYQEVRVPAAGLPAARFGEAGPFPPARRSSARVPCRSVTYSHSGEWPLLLSPATPGRR